VTAGLAATKGRHSAENDSWYTDPDTVDRAQYVLGDRIDLDPASSPEANERIGARRILTREDDALSKQTPWFAPHERGQNVFLNPPGGTRKVEGHKRAVSLPGLFWRGACTWAEAGHIEALIWIAFSIEDLQRTQKFSPVRSYRMLGPCTTICVPERRLRFIDSAGRPGKSPSHANAVVLFTPEPLSAGASSYRARFFEAFHEIGACK
jgi:hypothetical protein